MKSPTRWFLEARSWSASLSAMLAVSALTTSSALATPPPAGTIAVSLAAQEGNGTIKGRLVWGGAAAPAPKVLAEKGKAEKDPAVCAKDAAILSNQLVVDPKSKGVRYAFAYLVRPKGVSPGAVKEIVGKTPKVEIDQKNCQFVPHVVGLVEGQEIVFKSSDETNHNIRYAAFTNAAFNQMLPPNGQVGKTLVAERLPIKLACDIHPWMDGYMMVLPHPLFAVTGEDGSFEIKGVPAGPQKLVVWQEKVGYVTPGFGAGMPVDVKAGEVANVGAVTLDPAKVK